MDTSSGGFAEENCKSFFRVPLRFCKNLFATICQATPKLLTPFKNSDILWYELIPPAKNRKGNSFCGQA